MESKLNMYSRGKTRMEEFCKLNKLPVPEIACILNRPKEGISRPEACAWYKRLTYGGHKDGTITIRVWDCADGTKISYPGFIQDRTPFGAVAHETAHHVEFYGKELAKKVRAGSCEEPITAYHTNDSEWFAEMFRVFITNSTLIKWYRPKFYAIVTALGYKPVEARPWQEVLVDRPDLVKSAMGRKEYTLESYSL